MIRICEIRIDGKQRRQFVGEHLVQPLFEFTLLSAEYWPSLLRSDLDDKRAGVEYRSSSAKYHTTSALWSWRMKSPDCQTGENEGRHFIRIAFGYRFPRSDKARACSIMDNHMDARSAPAWREILDNGLRLCGERTNHDFASPCSFMRRASSKA